MAITLQGNNWGTLLGTGLAQGIEGVTQQKLQELAQRNEQARAEKGLAALDFLSPQQRQQIAMADPQTRPILLRGLQQQQLGQQEARVFNSLEGNGNRQVGGADIQQTLENGLRTQAGSNQSAFGFPINQPQGNIPLQVEQSGALNTAPVVDSLPVGSAYKLHSAFETKRQNKIKNDLAEKKMKLTEKLADARNDIQKQKIQNDIDKFTKQEARIEQEIIDKETLPFYEETKKSAKAAKDSDMRLGRMRSLIEKGELSGSKFAAALDTLSKGILGFGINLSSLTNADTQEFNKLSTDFIKDAKAIFGSRITDMDLASYLQTVPTLSQTDAGKYRVISNMEEFNDAKKIKDETAERIIQENGGRRPRGLEALVDKRAEPQLDFLAQMFKSGATKYLPKENNNAREGTVILHDRQRWMRQSGYWVPQGPKVAAGTPGASTISNVLAELRAE